MSDTDIVKYDENYIASLTNGASDEIEELAGEVNPLELMPRMVLPRDGTKDMKCTLGEDTIFTRRRVTAIVVWCGARRTLWQPEGQGGEDANIPVCSTGVVKVSTFNRNNDLGVGRWIVSGNEELPSPYASEELSEDQQVNVHCAECRFSNFGSTGLWDGTPGDAGKACKEGRILALRIVDETQQVRLPTGDSIGIFSYDPSSPIVLMNLSATSIKTVRKMATAAVSRNIPLSRIVWNLGAELKENGSIQWSVLDAELAGYPEKDVLLSLKADRDKVISLFTEDRAEVAAANTTIELNEQGESFTVSDVPF